MDSAFAPYISVYISRKDKLFPLIEKYSGQSLKNATHGQAVSLYVDLLRNNDGFRSEVEDIIKGRYKNAGDTLGSLALSLFPGTNTNTTIDKSPTSVSSGNSKSGDGFFSKIGSAVGGFVTGIANVGVSIFTSQRAYQTAKTEQDTVLYEAILEQQKQNDTGKIIVISVATLAIIGIGAWMVVKLKK